MKNGIYCISSLTYSAILHVMKTMLFHSSCGCLVNSFRCAVNDLFGGPWAPSNRRQPTDAVGNPQTMCRVEDDQNKTFLPPCIYKNELKWMGLTVMNCTEVKHSKQEKESQLCSSA
jgi:hypothetical protein